MIPQMESSGAILACISPQAFSENTIRPALLAIDLWSQAAEQLLLGTAIHESQGFSYRKQKHGPALGIFQMEPFTHDDIWNTYLKFHPDLSGKVTTLLSSPEADKHQELEFNDKYGAAMARVRYARHKAPIPPLNNIPAMAAYWKRYYNTALGKGTIKQFIRDWHRMMG